MKAIVVRQPWATLIALGVKSIETRPAPPNGPMRPDGVRGLPGCTLERGERIAVVAGAAPPKHNRRVGPWCPWVYSPGRAYLQGPGWPAPGTEFPLPLGAVVCTVVVADALPIADWGPLMRPASTDRWLVKGWHMVDHPLCVATRGAVVVDHQPTDQLPLGDFDPGRWGWMLTDPQPCDPVPCKGRQGVFELPADVAGAIS